MIQTTSANAKAKFNGGSLETTQRWRGSAIEVAT